mmetsp:Transcript_16404/g.35626  ORF Transcript_16404/g.35626 Transcript_16404/m.35626 type:complete len:337 (+) Transcript_16404:54-1064(+)|eukprot:CAMPEP_0185843626 /NCGR_PEP_ID=MMETSP1354-20130828/64_1 /TAXON_ID=708628 /ORGANISM="Erythrolobus madagascarensis, Strain CCMP3276" /LENGTH=336 /DNA_ID=CAMNT_0028543147 /DNA_START=38 /DNA_END=1048 /DNA_ORIENTATION=-
MTTQAGPKKTPFGYKLRLENPKWTNKSVEALSSLTVTPRSARSQSQVWTDSHQLKFCNTNFFELANRMRNEMDVKDRLIGLKVAANCVLATDVIRWLIANGECVNSSEAVFLGEGLVEHGHIYAVAEDEGETAPFENKAVPYRFSADDRDMASVLSERDMIVISSEFGKMIRGRTLKLGLVKIPEAVYASEITDWLVNANHAKNRGEAVNIAQMLLNRGAFHRPHSGDLRFRDGKVVYKLGSPMCWHNGELVTVSVPRSPRAPSSELKWDESTEFDGVTRSRSAASPLAGAAIFSPSIPKRAQTAPRDRVTTPNRSVSRIDELKSPSGGLTTRAFT